MSSHLAELACTEYLEHRNHRQKVDNYIPAPLGVFACFGVLATNYKDSLYTCFKYFQPDMGFPHAFFLRIPGYAKKGTPDAFLQH